MFCQWEQYPNLDRRHRPRTRNGCLTCRRRKVRCDEKRPLCGHCNRLSLECEWQQNADAKSGLRRKRVRQRMQQNHNEQSETQTKVAKVTPGPTPDSTAQNNNASAADESTFNEVFNYASFMWDEYPSSLSQSWETLDLSSSQQLLPWSDASVALSTSPDLPYSDVLESPTTFVEQPSRPLAQSLTRAPHSVIGWSESQLAECFAHSAAPPILATIETNARWTWMRKELISMASASRMVRYGVIAFVALELESSGDLEPTSYLQYYRTAKLKLDDCLREVGKDHKIVTSQLRHILAVLFLLSYIDLLTKDVCNAHANLREGFNALQLVDVESITMTEKRLLSWLRLLDARAVSAGGEGLFLTEDDSAISTDLRSPHSAITEVDSGLDHAEAALEDFILRPAYQFFQKVQLFMGRVSKIDPWHRRRGTVEDETEVMMIAAAITRDIQSLWQQRPPLMDHAVAGRLTTLLSPALAETITRTTRVYHANYYASFIHLHHLPRTNEVIKAMNEIRQVTQLILDSPWPSSPPAGTSTVSTGQLPQLPVNMLWPLLMLGVETEDVEQRTWVLSCIKGMENVASNAGITADVIQEVIRQQDETGQRVDIRKVMHEIFDRAFAIV